jgi:hypothetical protein
VLRASARSFKIVSKWSKNSPLFLNVGKIHEMCSVTYQDAGNRCIRYHEYWLDVKACVIILPYLSSPVSPTTSPRCPCWYSGFLVKCYCSSKSVGHKWDAWCRLAAISTISCFWGYFDSSICSGFGDCHSMPYPWDCVFSIPWKSNHRAC